MLIFRIRDFISVLFYRVIGKIVFVDFGKSVRIVFPLRILGAKFISINDNVTLQYNGFLAAIKINETIPQLVIKKGSLIGNYSHIVCTNKVTIHENVLIADKVYISDNLHDYTDVLIPVQNQSLKQLNDVEIGSGSWIGENVCIMGAKIGKNCVIGANSVVNKDIPDYCVAVGSPIEIIKRYCFESKLWERTDRYGNFINS
jgi:acetyltransferase-like isoleucine patch superfamily enzyme